MEIVKLLNCSKQPSNLDWVLMKEFERKNKHANQIWYRNHLRLRIRFLKTYWISSFCLRDRKGSVLLNLVKESCLEIRCSADSKSAADLLSWLINLQNARQFLVFYCLNHNWQYLNSNQAEITVNSQGSLHFFNSEILKRRWCQ